ncbi:hypothetical protein, partial [Burkholderia latens]
MSNVPKSPAPTRANAPSAKHPQGAADARRQQGEPRQQQQHQPQAGKPPRGPRGDERRRNDGQQGQQSQPAAKRAPEDA